MAPLVTKDRQASLPPAVERELLELGIQCG